MTHGQCLCGKVAYDVSGEPNWSSHCHCGYCRRHSGSAVATFVSFNESNFRFTRGAFSNYESSPGVTRSFCDRCGTPMAYRSTSFPGEIHLYLGTLDNPQDFPAQVQVYCAQKLPWLSIDEDIPTYETVPQA